MGRLRLVRGDTRPPVYVHLTDEAGPIDVSADSVTVRMNFRSTLNDTILQSLEGVKLPGTMEIDGRTVDTSRYPVAGSGGRVRFNFPAGSLDIEPGFYEGEVEAVSSDSSLTAYNKLEFLVRDEF